MLAVLNSSLFFWWWYSLFEGYHCGRHEVYSFPVGIEKMEQRIRSRLVVHANWLMHDYKRHSRRKAAIYRTSGRVEYDEFYPRESKGIINQIDSILSDHYGFSDVELDYLRNFDAKYRFTGIFLDG